ncbi:MAG: methyltransferase [Deltaproteobacteria bacterium]
MAEDQWNPGKLMKVSGAFWESFPLHAAVNLDLFTLIGDASLSAEEVAAHWSGPARSAVMLLDALAAMGLLEKKADQYSNTEAAKTLLVKTSPGYMGYAVKHHHHLVSAWSKLSEAVKTGKPVRKKRRSRTELESFLMAMYNNASGLAPKITREIDLSRKRHLLDLGGGPGTYAIHFCQANPDLRATVFDLPTTEPFARKTIRRFGLRSRIDFQAGDYLRDEVKGTYDVAWLSQILHSMGPEDCRTVIEKAVSVVELGGLVLVHDFLLNDTHDSPLFPALFALNMLVNTEEGRSYSEGEVRGMLTGAGVRDIRRLPFRGPTDSGIICGTV